MGAGSGVQDAGTNMEGTLRGWGGGGGRPKVTWIRKLNWCQFLSKNFAKHWICLLSPHLNFIITYMFVCRHHTSTSSWRIWAVFQKQTLIISRWFFCLQVRQFRRSRCCFAYDVFELYNVLRRTCWAIVLPIRSFVLPCLRCRSCLGFLKRKELTSNLTEVWVRQAEWRTTSRKSMSMHPPNLILIL